MKINRRAAVQLVSLGVGGLFTQGLIQTARGQKENAGADLFTRIEGEDLLAEIVDVIIPPTNTPGAKAAGVDKFILRVLRDCHTEKEAADFSAGLSRLQEECNGKFSKKFQELSLEEKVTALKACAVEQKGFFKKLRQLTVTGYFNSEIGASQALSYLPVPGRFEGSVPLEPGQKAWAL